MFGTISRLSGMWTSVRNDCEDPDSKAHGAYVGPTWGRQDPGGPHVGPMILVIWINIKFHSGKEINCSTASHRHTRDPKVAHTVYMQISLISKHVKPPSGILLTKSVIFSKVSSTSRFPMT